MFLLVPRNEMGTCIILANDYRVTFRSQTYIGLYVKTLLYGHELIGCN